MCIFCDNKLLAASDNLCKMIPRSEQSLLARKLELAFADKAAGADNAAITAMETILEILKLDPTWTRKLAERRYGVVPKDHDHEQIMLSLLLSYLEVALDALFTFLCTDSAEHKRLVAALLRIAGIEAACAAALAATIQLYRSGRYDNLPAIFQQAEFVGFCQRALIPAMRGGGPEWTKGQFSRWKRDHLMALYQSESNGPSATFDGCRVCWGCAGPTLDRKSGGRRLECTGCECAIFCSKECQKADWKANHKRLCPLLKNIGEEEGGMGKHGIVWAASTYYKWKRKMNNWKPMVMGQPSLQAFLAELEAIERVPSILHDDDAVASETSDGADVSQCSVCGTPDVQ